MDPVGRIFHLLSDTFSFMARLWISRQDARIAKKGKQRRAVGRRFRLLPAHHLIRKVSNTHRYHVTEFGRHILPAVLSARQVTLKTLNAKAAG
jgi:hypothetical protein